MSAAMMEPTSDGNFVLIDFVRMGGHFGTGYPRTQGSLCDGAA